MYTYDCYAYTYSKNNWNVVITIKKVCIISLIVKTSKSSLLKDLLVLHMLCNKNFKKLTRKKVIYHILSKPI